MRQQVSESNYKMVNILTQQISAVFNPLIQNTTQSYQQLAHQMGMIADFFWVPPSINQVPVEQPQSTSTTGD